MQKEPKAAPPEKKKKKVGPVFYIILVVLILVFLFAAYNLVKIGLTYKEASDSYKNVASVLEADPNYKEVTPEVEKGDPYAKDRVPFIWDYNKILAMNEDTKGWIYEKDLFSYPIVQGTDNSYYLYNTFERVGNPSGAIFIDCDCKDGLEGKYSIVYGHNMDDGSMFGKLLQYEQKEDFYKKHPTMHIFSGEKHYIYNVISAYTAEVNGFTYMDPLTDIPTSEFVKKVRDASISKMYDGEIKDDTPIIVLSTCTPSGADEYRFVVILARDHEVPAPEKK